MKSSTKNIATGNMHQVKGKIKEVTGIVVDNRDLEAEGKAERLHGKIQEKIGDIEKVVEE